jgi:hypothetical protein
VVVHIPCFCQGFGKKLSTFSYQISVVSFGQGEVEKGRLEAGGKRKKGMEN